MKKNQKLLIPYILMSTVLYIYFLIETIIKEITLRPFILLKIFWENYNERKISEEEREMEALLRAERELSWD